VSVEDGYVYVKRTVAINQRQVTSPQLEDCYVSLHTRL